MSGCHPTNNVNTHPCLCFCHSPTGYKVNNCCLCNTQNSVYKLYETNVSPMVKHIQELEERIEKLEEFHSSWKKMPKWDLKDFIELVNSHEEQIKQISDWMLDKQDKIKYLEQKNEKLEYFKREYFDQFNRTYSWIREIEKIALESVSDIKKLESVLDVKKMEQIICDGAKLHAEVLRLSDKLANSTLSKKPYKCPVCEGAGMNTTKLVVENINGPNIVGMKHPECISCEGKGIVWSQ